MSVVLFRSAMIRAMASRSVSTFAAASARQQASSWMRHHMLPQRRILAATTSTMIDARPSRLYLRSASSFVTTEIPEYDYYDGHLMTDHLEYVDDVLETTLKLEEIVQGMDQICAQKKHVVQLSQSAFNVIDPAEVDDLFLQAELKSTDLKKYLASLKEIIKSTQQKHTQLHDHALFAVDAPDGTPDAEDTLVIMNFNKVNQKPPKQPRKVDHPASFAVDAPDGTPDSEVMANMVWIAKPPQYERSFQDGHKL
jgi:hypothetical protein